MLSDVAVTPQIERNIIEAFKKLHQYRAYHGDIRPANIIVRDDESVVLIDFERSVLNADKAMLSEERDQVRHMLQVVQKIESKVFMTNGRIRYALINYICRIKVLFDRSISNIDLIHN